MYLDSEQVAKAILRFALRKSLETAVVVAYRLLPLLVFFTFLGMVAWYTYAARYIDASGASCVAFDLGNHEIDLCHGRIDR